MTTAAEHDGIRGRTFRWGLLGAGTISHEFARHLRQSPGARLHAVASRRAAHAESFARSHGVDRVYPSYAALCEDPEIDIVYIATPTPLHHEHCLLALSLSKAVLCEKPFTISAEAASEVARFARERRLFCMEAMWMRFNPHIQSLRRLLSSGAIGAIRSLRAEVGWAKADSEDRSREDGGAMLSFGCYALSLAWFLLGHPEGYLARVVRNTHGLDVSCGMLLRYPGALVTLSASISATQSNEILAVGSDGSVTVHPPFIDARSMDVLSSLQDKHIAQRLGGRLGRLGRQLAQRLPFLSVPGIIRPGAGLRGEIEETMRCLSQGQTESKVMPLNESLAIHQCLDRIRAQTD